MMPQHIGIVGCSAEGAALCYRTICTEGTRVLGPHAHPEVSMHTPSLARYTACPDNTIHQAFAQVEPISPQPWLHIAEVGTGAWACSGPAGWSTARSTRTSSPPAGCSTCARTPPNATRSTASSWTSW
jgi:hypothetical protein